MNYAGSISSNTITELKDCFSFDPTRNSGSKRTRKTNHKETTRQIFFLFLRVSMVRFPSEDVQGMLLCLAVSRGSFFTVREEFLD